MLNAGKALAHNKEMSRSCLFRIFNLCLQLEKIFILHHPKLTPVYELETHLRSLPLWPCYGDCYCILDTIQYRVDILADHLHHLCISDCQECTRKLFPA